MKQQLLMCGVGPDGVVGAGFLTVAALQLPLVGGVVTVAETSRGKDVDAQSVFLPHIAHPWRDERLVGAVHAEAHKLVALDVCRGHDVDDRLGVGGIFRRRVGDRFDTRDGVSRKVFLIKNLISFLNVKPIWWLIPRAT